MNVFLVLPLLQHFILIGASQLVSFLALPYVAQYYSMVVLVQIDDIEPTLWTLYRVAHLR